MKRDPIGLGTVALAFAVALPFSLASARTGIAVFAVLLGGAALLAARGGTAGDRPPPPPTPLRRDQGPRDRRLH